MLDLACGAGHSTFFMHHLFPHRALTAADHDLTNLYMIRRYFVPEATLLCIDLERPLPFARDSFSSVFCLDAFHYIRSKAALSRELRRVVTRKGVWIFAHLHNAQTHNVNAGLPLSLEAYRNCFGSLPTSFFPERHFLDSLMHQRAIDLGASFSDEELEETNALCMIGTHRESIRRPHRNPTSRMARSLSAAANPIYRSVSGRPGWRHVEMQWPSEALRQECAPVEAYLPSALSVDEELWSRIEHQRTTVADEAPLRPLVEAFVAVPLPSSYGTPPD